jgi:hypothetical protein
MDIKTLLGRLEHFPRLPHEANWDFGFAIAALYAPLLQLEDCEGDFSDWVDRADFDVFDVIDLPHHSDEACYVQVVAHQQTPFALVYKFGDVNNAQMEVLDVDVYRRVGALIAARRAEALLSDVAATSVTSLSGLPNQYLHWVDEKAGLFTVTSPKAYFGFLNLTKEYAAVCQTPSGTLQLVRSMQSYVTGTPSWSGDHRVSLTLGNGETLEVDGREIVFSLFPAEDLPEVARGAVNVSSSWALHCVVMSHIVRIFERKAGTLGQRSVSIAFEDKAARNAFLKQYQGAVHDGELNLEAVGAQPV